MATLRQIQSPGVQINEVDLSQTSTAPNGTSVFMVGYAAQGPASEVVSLTTNQDFQNIFGSPVTPAERYLYYSVQQIFNAGTNAQISVVRLPYGSGLGNGYNSNVYSALVYPVIPTNYAPIPLSSSPAVALASAAGAINAAIVGSTTYLASAVSYFFGAPTLIELSQQDYISLKQNGVNWNPQGGGTAPTITGLTSLSSTGIGMIVINEAQTTINEKFEGYYLNLADNTNINPNTNFTSVQNLYSVSLDKGLGVAASYVTVPTTRLSFELSAAYTDQTGSVSQTIENIPSYDISTFGLGGFSDLGILSLFKIKTSPFGTNALALNYTLQEGYAASFYSNRTIQDVNGGAPVNDFMQNVVNDASTQISVLVNPYISNNTYWLDVNGNATKCARVLTTTLGNYITTNFGNLEGYAPADALFPLGVYAPSLNVTTNKQIGDVAGKLQTAINIISNKDLYNIDVICDAGLSTIAAYSPSAISNTGTYDDTLFNTAISNSISGLTVSNGTYQPDPVVQYWSGITNQFIQLAGSIRKDCIFISDPLRGIFVQGTNFKTLNNKSLNFSSNIYWPLNNLYTPINTSYAAAYANWVSIIDQFTNNPVWMPFSAYAAAAYTNNDAVAYPWGAPAGLTRGAITGVTDIAINPQQSQRDLLYKASINPVVNFPNEGVSIYGQKTLLAVPSAFDRINVRRLFLFLEKSVLNTSKYFVFEPNTTFTQNRLVSTIKPVFELAKNTQGIYDYLIVCNSTNNTPSVVDDNSLVVDIYIKPVRTAEFILINFYCTKTSQDFNELLQ